MMFKHSSVGALVLALVAFFLLLNCLPGNIACADGAGGQWPLDPPPNPAGGDDEGGGDGSSENTTLFTLSATLGFLL
jgi:hypothetical protein